MKLDWMGRYRELVAALTLQSNLYSKSLTVKSHIYEDIYLTAQEWQVLEYIVEHEQDDDSMKQLSERLAIPQSSFSKQTKLLCEYKLVDRYQLVGNRKNIILKPSEKGKKVYEIHAKALAKAPYQEFFESLSGISDKDLKTFVDALNRFSGQIPEKQEQKLIKLDT